MPEQNISVINGRLGKVLNQMIQEYGDIAGKPGTIGQVYKKQFDQLMALQKNNALQTGIVEAVMKESFKAAKTAAGGFDQGLLRKIFDGTLDYAKGKDMVDITGLPKDRLLIALYNKAKPIDTSSASSYAPLPYRKAKGLVGLKLQRNQPLAFAQMNDKRLDIDITDNEFDAKAYDRHNGAGSARLMVAKVARELAEQKRKAQEQEQNRKLEVLSNDFGLQRLLLQTDLSNFMGLPVDVARRVVHPDVLLCTGKAIRTD